MKLKYYSELDGVRGVAALMVMVFHFFQHLTSSGITIPLLTKISVFGQTGVDLFFVLSGFLITRILLETKNSEGFFSNFYIRRSVRIFPLYYLILILLYFIIPVIQNTTIPPFSQQAYYWFYLQNFSITFNWKAVGPGHFWSLGVEEHFYLFWPLVVYMMSRKNLPYALLLLVVISFITRIVMTAKGYEVFYFTLTRFDSLAIGAILSLIELKGLLKKASAKKFLIGIFLMFIPIILLWLVYGGAGAGFIQVVKPLLIATLYFLVIGYIVSSESNNLFKKIFDSPPLSYTGKISYGLYVYHPFVFSYMLTYATTGSVLFDFFICMLASYVVASLSYYLFEIKFLKLKRYFEYKKNKINTAQALTAP